MLRIGVISDTHGLLRPQAVQALQGCERIIHAGDIGAQEVLHHLAEIAPVTAVRGNNDTQAWASELAEQIIVDFHGISICVVHDIDKLRGDLIEHAVHAIIAGHSHKPGMQMRGGVLYFNPGSAGPRRFKLPVALGYLDVDAGTLSPRIVELAV
jgi:uncharacterized protein